MAESPGRMSELLKSLEEEVKCPVCMETFTKPKKLPCDHILCTPCLENMILKSTLYKSITCPVCRATCPLPESGASQFPTAHQVNRIIDIYQKTLCDEAQENPVVVETPPQHPFCPIHSSQPLALYCETCKKSVCRDCVIFSCSKDNHKFDLLEEIAKKHKAEVDTEASYLKELQWEISEILEICLADGANLQAQKLKEQENIKASFDVLLDNIMAAKNDIITNMEARFKVQSNVYRSKANNLKQNLKSITSALESTESISREPLAKQIEKSIAQKELLKTLYFKARQVKLLETQVSRGERKIKVMSHHYNPKKSMLYVWQEYTCFMDKYDNLESLQINEHCEIDFYPHRAVIKATDLTSALIRSADNTLTVNNIMELPNHVFRLSVTPQKLGKHTLHILYHGAHICGSPISTFVYFDLQPDTPFKPLSHVALSDAAGIKCYSDEVYVTLFEEGIHVMKIGKEGSLTELNTISLPGVNEIIVHENHFYCTEILKHMLVKADLAGHVIASTGGRGTELGKFHSPNGIAINSLTNEIFVCDTCNNRIQVFDDSLNFVRVIGSEGNNPGEFDSPGHIVLDKDSNMYVVEYDNHRIQVLTQQGVHVRFIEDEHIWCPISADIFCDQIYITNTYGHRISVYTLAGDFVTSFGENTEYITPECIAIDRNGFIFVTYDRKGVVQFSKKKMLTSFQR